MKCRQFCIRAISGFLCVAWFACIVLPIAADEPAITLKNRVRQRGLLAATYFPKGKQPEIVVFDFGAGNVIPIASHPALDEYPALAPSGKKVAFYSDRTGDREIFVADVEGAGLAQLTSSPGADEDPSWSPDEKRIAFHSSRLGRGANIFVMNADGTEPKSFTSRESKNTVPKFSPDGKSVVFSTDGHWPGWDLEEVNLDSGQTRSITSGLRTSCRASYSPEGKELVYSFGSGKDIDLWLMTPNGEAERRLTDRPGKEYDAVFTTDGSGIFFVAEQHRGKGDFQIFYLDRPSGKVTQVTESPGYYRYLSWSAGPDS